MYLVTVTFSEKNNNIGPWEQCIRMETQIIALIVKMPK